MKTMSDIGLASFQSVKVPEYECNFPYNCGDCGEQGYCWKYSQYVDEKEGEQWENE